MCQSCVRESFVLAHLKFWSVFVTLFQLRVVKYFFEVIRGSEIYPKNIKEDKGGLLFQSSFKIMKCVHHTFGPCAIS